MFVHESDVECDNHESLVEKGHGSVKKLSFDPPVPPLISTKDQEEEPKKPNLGEDRTWKLYI